MFEGLFQRKSKQTEAPAANETAMRYDSTGVRYRSPATTTSQWLAAPFAHAESADLGARLAQICLEGYGQKEEAEFVLSWADLYAVLRHPELGAFRDALRIPSASQARPGVTSRGALMDENFAVFLGDWVDPQGRSLQPRPKIVGRVIDTAGTVTLLPEAVHELLTEIEAFHATPESERLLAFKELAFGRIRKQAIAAGCPVSDYVARTIVLTPDRLQLTMERRGEGDSAVVEVLPGFDAAPSQWLSQFDRLPLQDVYHVPDGASLVRVLVSPEVRSVLAEIKRMPGRRAAGPRAEAFVRNPYAMLGANAAQVIDLAQFEQAREAAGISFDRFIPMVQRNDQGEISNAGIQVESISAQTSDAELLWFEAPDTLAQFIDKVSRRIKTQSQCCMWEGHELEILGDTPDHLAQLESWLRQWRHPRLWSASEVLNLSNYSARVESIGIESPFATPIIVRNNEDDGWFEENVTIGIRVGNDTTGTTILPLSFAEIPSLQQAVHAAERANELSVRLPGLQTPIPLKDARDAVEALLKAQRDLKLRCFDGPVCHSPQVSATKRLIIKSNFEGIDYTEDRAESLEMDEGREPHLPQALKKGTVLKEHQKSGIAWLQHLWAASPQRCRGTVLADDMGLGKTLQLLTFISSCFESDPSLPPALVVAPVALLENWRNELQRFFEPGTLPLLTLYGAELKRLRVSKHELDDELQAQGVTRLLKRNWVGDARLVLTTYETLRDMEFALASQSWSIMVCDEAQKIKTPAAMVTRSAKKQKVRFRIACTGTPVENTLADLWCLFDFVQPGMLGALNHFSRTYRQPIEAKTPEQQEKVEELRTLIKPQILHRKKMDVAKDLPAPIEDDLCKRLPMSVYQLRLYAAALATLREQRETNPSAQLQTLMAIRQICSDPHGHDDPNVRSVTITKLLNESPKLGWMVNRLTSLAKDRNGTHKVIIFCEFRELQLTLQRVVAAQFGFAPHIINGDTSADPAAAVNRQKLIDDFQQPTSRDINIIILSPLAVGFGVNIQAANHVIHFTRTWNPAKEDQATARAHRIGQTRQVTVYYPGVVSSDFPSFDVRLDALLGRKRALASDMLNGCSDLTVADFAEFG